MSLDLRTEGAALEPTPMDTEPATGPAAATVAVRPVEASERLLRRGRPVRGFALLGILAMNIVHFGWGEAVYDNPTLGGGFEGTDRVVWFFNHLVFEGKMMTIFSMLFGAGLVLMDQRAASRKASVLGVYYRRVLWLLAIGLVHAYLIWSGDILVLYAECGLLLYFFRNLSPRTLIITGVACLLLFVPVMLGIAGGLDYMKAAAARVEAQEKAGEDAAAVRQAARGHLDEACPGECPAQPRAAGQGLGQDDRDPPRCGYLGIVKHRAPQMFFGHIFELIFAVPFFVGGRMLIGMGLMKLGIFSGARSRRFYLWMVGLGYGIGLPLMVFDAFQLIDHQFSTRYELHGGMFYNAFGSVIVALAHVGTCSC